MEDALNLWREGMPQHEIAKRLGVSPSTVGRRLKAARKGRVAERPRLTIQERDAIQVLKENGFSITWIAKAFRRTRHTVYKAAKDADKS